MNPTVGTRLYLLDGTPISGSSLVLYDAAMQGYYVRVRPPLDKHSIK
jgi:hypothetical protein